MKLTSYKHAVFAMMLSVAASVAVVGPAGAQEAQVNEIEIHISNGSVLLELDEPMDAEAAEREVAALFGPLNATIVGSELEVTPRHDEALVEIEKMPSSYASTDELDGLATAEALAADYFQVFCDESYSFSDSNGTFSVQRRCGIAAAPWSWRMSYALQKICVNGTVKESGLKWTKNGVTQPKMSPHAGVICGYYFHGTFRVHKGDRVTYNDTVTFRHNLGSGGNATVRFDGRLKFRGRA